MYNLIKAGDMSSMEDNMRLFVSSKVGHLSDNPLQDKKYLFVASTTLTTRFCIEGGMDEDVAYTASDLYIQRLDQCRALEELLTLYEDMLTYFTTQMAELKKKAAPTKTIAVCMDYIYYHLHEHISVAVLAEEVKLSPSYLSVRFKEETGQTISNYITALRMEAAKNMLLYSDISFAEIASILAFSSQSYFIKVFRQTYGTTPAKYRQSASKAALTTSHFFSGEV